METLHLAMVQTELAWEDPVKNQIDIETFISDINTPTDIIILPEMFSTGFTMNPYEVAQSMDGETVQWMKKIAKSKNCAICGSIIVKDQGKFYNRFLFITPDDSILFYDKKHTFTLAGEHEVYNRGKEKLIIDYKGWKICPLICYDLRFPVWARNVENYDLLLYVANWPDKRVNAWDALLKARAIENMVYSVGVNRIGKDGNKLEYCGHSAIYDVLGNTVAFSDKKEIITATIYKSDIAKYRDNLMFLQDRDAFNLK